VCSHARGSRAGAAAAPDCSAQLDTLLAQLKSENDVDFAEYLATLSANGHSNLNEYLASLKADNDASFAQLLTTLGDQSAFNALLGNLSDQSAFDAFLADLKGSSQTSLNSLYAKLGSATSSNLVGPQLLVCSFLQDLSQIVQPYGRFLHLHAAS
jgi:hypothetical protein